MKKVLVVYILVIVMIASLVSCSRKRDDGNGTEAPTQAPVEECKEELVYKLNEDGQSYTLVNFGKCTCSDIVIPETYNGLPVTIIGDGAFNRCYRLKSVTIPSSVTEIWHRAFANCYQLESVNIPSSVTGIGHYVFTGCKALKSVVIPSSVAYVGGNTFQGCEGVTVNCEVESQPTNWDRNWSVGATVVWGYSAE